MLLSLPNAFGDAPTNMAIDAALLETMPEGLAAFRHYGWLEPAATFGYAQTHKDVQETIGGNELSLVRRLTGGGIVDHRNDWTYALIIHSSLTCATIPATEIYKLIHRAISLSLGEMKIESHLAPCPRACTSPDPASHTPDPPDLVAQCFVTPAANDVLRPDGQKIAGAAMKRNRYGLLIQGSVDRTVLIEDLDFTKFKRHLLRNFSVALGLTIGAVEDIRPLFNSQLIEDKKQKFSSKEWNQRR